LVAHQAEEKTNNDNNNNDQASNNIAAGEYGTMSIQQQKVE
jgi:hypothetical protein